MLDLLFPAVADVIGLLASWFRLLVPTAVSSVIKWFEISSIVLLFRLANGSLARARDLPLPNVVNLVPSEVVEPDFESNV